MGRIPCLRAGRDVGRIASRVCDRLLRIDVTGVWARVRDLDSGDCIRACVRGWRRGLGEIALKGRTTFCAPAWFLCGLFDLGEMVRSGSFVVYRNQFSPRQVATKETIETDLIGRDFFQFGIAR